MPVYTNSAIHEAAGLMVPGCSMALPGTISETAISREWEPVAGPASGGHSNCEQLCGRLRESGCKRQIPITLGFGASVNYCTTCHHRDGGVGEDKHVTFCCCVPLRGNIAVFVKCL